MIKLGDILLCSKTRIHTKNNRIVFEKGKLYEIYAIDESDGDVHIYTDINTTMKFIRKNSINKIGNDGTGLIAPNFGDYFKCREGKLRSLLD